MEKKTLEDKLGNLKKAQKQMLDDMKTQRHALVKDYFHTATEDLFNSNPSLDNFGFYCYADYWNDGDECPFEVHYDENSLMINGYSNYYDEENDEDEENRLFEYGDASNGWKKIWRDGYEQLAKEIQDFLSSIDTNDYEEMFGNDTKIVVDRKGVTITEHTSHG